MIPVGVWIHVFLGHPVLVLPGPRFRVYRCTCGREWVR